MHVAHALIPARSTMCVRVCLCYAFVYVCVRACVCMHACVHMWQYETVSQLTYVAGLLHLELLVCCHHLMNVHQQTVSAIFPYITPAVN